MAKYLVRRLLLAIPTLFGVTVLIFLIMRVIPGDPLQAMMGREGGSMYMLTEAELEVARTKLGLDKPYHEQYLNWMGDIARGELGKSFFNQTPIRDLIIRKAPVTAELAVIGVVISWLIGLPVGILSALWRNSWFDIVSRFLVILFMAIPNFWLGLTFMLITVSVFTWRPPLNAMNLFEDPVGNLQMVIGPSVAIGIGLAAQMARITRSSVMEVLNEDYVRTAKAKGLRETRVIWRHVLKNALLPIITVSGLLLGYFLGGSVAVERAFTVPGLGLQLVQAINERDWMVIQNLVLLYGVIFVVINLLVDISYALVDPRIQFD